MEISDAKGDEKNDANDDEKKDANDSMNTDANVKVFFKITALKLKKIWISM